MASNWCIQEFVAEAGKPVSQLSAAEYESVLEGLNERMVAWAAGDYDLSKCQITTVKAAGQPRLLVRRVLYPDSAIEPEEPSSAPSR